MSLDATIWAWKQPVPKSSPKFVLVALADRAGADNCAFPAVDTLSKDTALNRKTVIAALQYLCEAGFIADTGRRAGSSGRVVVYQLLNVPNRHDNKPTSPKRGQSQKRDNTKKGTVPKTEANSPQNGTSDSPKNGTQNLPIELPIEPSDESERVQAPAPAPAAESNLFATDAAQQGLTADNLIDLNARQRFPMTLDWQPGTGLAERCASMGITPGQLSPDDAQDVIAEFCSYWAGRGDLNTHGGWEHKLAQRIKQTIVRQQSQGNRAEVSASLMDLNNTDWTNPANDKRSRRAAVSGAVMNIHDTDW